MIEKKSSRNKTISSELLESVTTNKVYNIDLLKLINLVSKQSKTGQDIRQISILLQKNLNLQYFRKLQRKVSDNDYIYFLSNMEIVSFNPTTFIIEKKKKNHYFYIILEGVVDVLDQIFTNKENQNNVEYEIINTIEKGSCFGENSLMNLKAYATAWIKSRTHVILISANYETFCHTLNKPQITIQQEKFKFILNNPLFNSIEQNVIKDILSEIRTEVYCLNEKIYSKDEIHDQLYLIYAGEVQIRKFNDRKQVNKSFGLVIIGEGEYFGVEDDTMQQQYRTETAISKSNELIIHKILFKRLKILKSGYAQFCENLSRHLKKKIQLYNQLYEKHEIINNLNTSVNQKIKKRTKLKKYKIKKNKPSLQWWGVTHHISDTRSLLLNKKISSAVQKQEDKERQIIFTNSRIRAFVNQFNYRKSLAQDVEQQEEEQSCYISPFHYQYTIPPKSLKKQPQNSKIKSKLLPSIRKENLIHYAKSQNSFVQKLLLN